VSERIDGAFLLVIVCMQSLAVLGGLLAEPLAGYGNAVVLLSMSYFGSGYVLYFVVVTVVTYRLLDGPIRPDDWTGPYWITMGAAAITTLAGTTLGPRLETFQGWEPYAPVIIGVTFLAWAIASWWIPLLLVVDIWKFLTGGGRQRPPTCLGTPLPVVAAGIRRPPAHVRADGVGACVPNGDVHRQYAEYRRDRDIRSPLRRSRVLGLVRAGGCGR